MKLKIKKLHKDAIIPKKSNPTDSGLDLCALEDGIIYPNRQEFVRTGIAIQLPKPVEMGIYPTELGVKFRQTIIWEAQIRPRSGLAKKKLITITNSPGTIDNHYRGEICILLFNLGEENFYYKKGDRIAQIVICPVVTPEVIEVDELDDTDRGDGGFGSTGN